MWPTMSPAKFILMKPNLQAHRLDPASASRRTSSRVARRRARRSEDLDVGFQLRVELVGPVAVPEVGDVPELLCLGARPLGNSAEAMIADRRVDRLGTDQIRPRGVRVSVVQRHPGEVDVGSTPPTVELVEIWSCLERLRQLDGAVTPEVEHDHGIAVDDRADRLLQCVTTVVGSS